MRLAGLSLRAASRPALRPGLPRRTVRLRLTLLYGALFLASGIGLLALTNVLVRQATGDVMLFAARDGDTPSPRVVVQVDNQRVDVSDPQVNELLQAQAEQFRASARRQQQADRRQLLIQSGVALGVMAFVSMGLGWLVAGRVLRPLRTITATAREISVTNLHERLALSGPDDELKELGDTFDELLARLERAFEAQRQFVANASHELRTPLARQRTLIEVALGDQEASRDDLRATYERVLASGEQQEQLIEALLTLARSERGLERAETVDLAAVAERAVSAAAAEAGRRGLELRTNLGAAGTLGDEALIERLVSNLLDNALRYNAPGGFVSVDTYSHDGGARLRVCNSGPVIPEAEVQGLFEPFRRLGADRLRRDGHGLGLSIVRSVAAAHGASVQATARPQGGLEVEVVFAAAAKPARDG